MPASILASQQAGFRFSPAQLFASNEPGVWFDPSDRSTLFQDVAGVNPVTAAGQTVALMLDKSGGGNHATQATASFRPIYQIDANGRPFLLFDGVDDGMVTPTITPGTDKVQMFVGVTKSSDTPLGFVFFLGPPGGGETFFSGILAPINASVGYGATVGFDPVITLGTDGLSFPAPNTSVVSAQASASENFSELRVNSEFIGNNPSSQGLGVYPPGPIFLGRRVGGSSPSPFNGRLYGLITRFGANLTPGQISATENWMNARTGAY